jgi:DNA-binding transcriptional ArsR family regulator
VKIIHLTFNPKLIIIRFIMPRRTPPTTVLTAAQVRSLASPARLEIIEAFSALGRASARELAAHLGRSPGAVYHHLRALEHAGVVREVARRPGARRPEAVYGPAAGRMAVAASPRRGDQQAAVHAMKAVLRQAARDADRVFAQGVETLKGRFHGLQLSGALLPADIKRVLALLGELEAVFREANRTPSRAGEIFRWTSLFMPIRRTRS